MGCTICILEVEEEFIDQYTRFTTELCARPILSYELKSENIFFDNFSRLVSPMKEPHHRNYFLSENITFL